MSDNESLILGDIHDNYVPFLKKLIAYLEKNKKISPGNLNRLKSIYTAFTTSSISEQIQVFNANKKRLEKWFKNKKNDKMTDDVEAASIQRSKRAFVEDTSQGATDAAPSKQSRNESSSSAAITHKKEEKAAPTPATLTVATLPIPAPSDANENGELLFSCAYCLFQSFDEQDFMKHAKTEHRSNVSMWCKKCGKCFSNALLLVTHIKNKACLSEEMIYRCGVKGCTFESTNGQTFVHHLRNFHRDSSFIYCVHCQKLFTLPHCLILHMQDDCPYKEQNRKNPGTIASTPQVPTTTPAATAPKPMASTISSVTSAVQSNTPFATSPVTVARRGRGTLTRSIRGRLPRGRGRKPLFDESSDSDTDDPAWEPEKVRRSSRLA